MIRICKHFYFLSPELLALELLDFIHVMIEDAATLVDDQLHEKSLRDYLQAHLEEKESEDTSDMVLRIHQDFKVSHAISMFDFVVKKIRERA